ncbi:MAG: hypothetical protein IPI30_04330 [Saprospiraceae bacterium]|nr:hypothetical protein [Candidatus Vicinibacter affinis]
MESEVKLVMFDMSGTTVKDKNEVLDCFLISAERTGLSTDASEINSMMGMSKIEVFTQLWTNQLPNASQDVLESKIKIHFSYFRKYWKDGIRKIRLNQWMEHWKFLSI